MFSGVAAFGSAANVPARVAAVTMANVSSCSALVNSVRTTSICVRARSGSRSPDDSNSTTQSRRWRDSSVRAGNSGR